MLDLLQHFLFNIRQNPHNFLEIAQKLRRHKRAFLFLKPGAILLLTRAISKHVFAPFFIIMLLNSKFPTQTVKHLFSYLCDY